MAHLKFTPLIVQPLPGGFRDSETHPQRGQSRALIGENCGIGGWIGVGWNGMERWYICVTLQVVGQNISYY